MWLAALSGTRRRRAGVAVVGAIVALLVGASLAAEAGARRSTTSLDRFVAFTRVEDCSAIPLGRVSMSLVDQLPEVVAAKDVSYIGMEAITADGTVDTAASGVINAFLRVPRVGGGDDLYRPRVLAGRDVDPHEPREIVVNEELASLRHLEVGSTLRMIALAPGQQAGVLNGEAPKGPRIDFTVVGIARHPEDVYPQASEFGAAYGGTQGMELSPAFGPVYGDLVARYEAPGGPWQSIRLRHGGADIEAFRSHVAALPGGDQVRIDVGGSDAVDATQRARRAISVETVALEVLAAALALAAVTIAGQGLARLVASAQPELQTLSAMGMSPRHLMAVAALPAVVAAIAGILTAVVVAIVASPLTPIGLARIAEIHPGVHVDGLLLLTGPIAASAVFGVAIAMAARRVRPTYVRTHVQRAAPRFSYPDRLATLAAPVGAIVGLRFATRSGRSLRTGPVRVAAAAGAAGVFMLVAVVTFTASLDRLAGDAAAQGWSWDLKLGNPNISDYGDTDAARLAADPMIAGYRAIADPQLTAMVNGVEVGLGLLGSGRGSVGPRVVSGRLPSANGEIVLGHRTADRLGVGPGNRVIVNISGHEFPMEVVGTALLNPALGSLMTMGDGALVSFGEAMGGVPDLRQNGFLLELAPGFTANGAEPPLTAEWGHVVQGPQTPTDVTNVIRVRTLPVAIALLIAAIGLVMLGFTLVATAHHRRRDLALLRALGATRRQAASYLLWQATVMWVVAGVVGVPLGVVAGRLAWRILAADLGVLIGPRVPAPLLGAVVVLYLLVVMALAAGPAILAARTPLGPSLRDDGVG